MPQNSRQVTRADVARHAGVSVTVVSYVLNGNRYVREDKRERVMEAIAALRYRPNSIARALKGKKTNSILFIADQIANEHFSRIITAMDGFAYDRGYLISLCANRNDDEFISQIICRHYDGIVISSISFPADYIKQLSSEGVPIVLLMTRSYDELPGGVALIQTGLWDGARACVRHLYETGHRRLLYLDRVSRHNHFSDMSDLRYSGFVTQAREMGLDIDEKNVITGCHSEDEVISAIARRYNDGFHFDAIFGRNDRIACLGLMAARELGLRVPEDVSLVGYDNSSLSQYLSPKLTTVETQYGAIGRAAVEMLSQMINGQTPSGRYFAPRLIERGSVATRPPSPS